MILNKIFKLVAITTIASLIIISGCDSEPPVSPKSIVDEPEVSLSKQGQLREVQSAVAKYHSLEQALADGFVQVTSCDESPGEGAQGFHFLNPALLDEVVNHTTPELLMYIPTEDGLKFVGVEYAVLNNGQSPPSLFGHTFHPFDGLYVLHLWVLPEVPNPSGLFADWNPNLSCNGR